MKINPTKPKINWKKSLSAALLATAAISLAGCEVDVDEGPLEEVGEEVDDATGN